MNVKRPQSKTQETALTARSTIAAIGVDETDLPPAARQAIERLAGDVDALRRELDETRERLREAEKAADSDPMLGLLNRRAFEREIKRAQALVERHEVEATLVFIDVNRLKVINDERGHEAGDAALRRVGECLRARTRATDVVARLGGDEFALILLHADEKKAARKMQRLSSYIEQRSVEHEGDSFHLSIAWGVAPIAPNADPTALLALADKRMYQRKSGGDALTR